MPPDNKGEGRERERENDIGMRKPWRFRGDSGFCVLANSRCCLRRAAANPTVNEVATRFSGLTGAGAGACQEINVGNDLAVFRKMGALTSLIRALKSKGGSTGVTGPAPAVGSEAARRSQKAPGGFPSRDVTNSSAVTLAVNRCLYGLVQPRVAGLTGKPTGCCRTIGWQQSRDSPAKTGRGFTFSARWPMGGGPYQASSRCSPSLPAKEAERSQRRRDRSAPKRDQQSQVVNAPPPTYNVAAGV